VIRDLNPDARINPVSDSNVCRIAPEMLWIHYLVGISHFAECRVNRQWLYEKGNRSPKISYS